MKQPPPLPTAKPKPKRTIGKPGKRGPRSGLVSRAGTVIDIKGVPSRNRAIMRSFLLYMQAPGVSLREIWGQGSMSDDVGSGLICDHVSIHAIERASADGSWPVQREKHWQEIQARVLREAQTHAVQAEMEELGVLIRTRQRLMVHVEGSADVRPVRPKSLEGVVGALVQVDRRVSEKRARVSEAIAAAAADQERRESHSSTASPVPLIADDLSDEEIEAAAAEIVRRRASAPLRRVHTDGEGENGR